MTEFRQSIGLFFERAGAVAHHFIDNFPSDLLDILFVALLIYGLLRLIRQTRGAQLLKGLFWLALAYGLVNLLKMNASIYIFRQGIDYLVVVLVVLFQPEIRTVFERMGRSNASLMRLLLPQNQIAERKAITRAVRQCCEAFRQFSAERTGALVVFERVTMLGEIVKTGTVLQARASRELIGNVFFPKAPLHDGAAIMRKGVLEAAGCILPLSQNQNLDAGLGTRHRAALGVSEESDAMAALVSEETGTISLAFKGQLTRGLRPEDLERALLDGLLAPETQQTPLDRLRTHILKLRRSRKARKRGGEKR